MPARFYTLFKYCLLFLNKYSTSYFTIVLLSCAFCWRPSCLLLYLHLAMHTFWLLSRVPLTWANGCCCSHIFFTVSWVVKYKGFCCSCFHLIVVACIYCCESFYVLIFSRLYLFALFQWLTYAWVCMFTSHFICIHTYLIYIYVCICWLADRRIS